MSIQSVTESKGKSRASNLRTLKLEIFEMYSHSTFKQVYSQSHNSAPAEFFYLSDEILSLPEFAITTFST